MIWHIDVEIEYDCTQVHFCKVIDFLLASSMALRVWQSQQICLYYRIIVYLPACTSDSLLLQQLTSKTSTWGPPPPKKKLIVVVKFSWFCHPSRNMIILIDHPEEKHPICFEMQQFVSSLLSRDCIATRGAYLVALFVISVTRVWLSKADNVPLSSFCTG